jgi:PAS domain S-box-containing protein
MSVRRPKRREIPWNMLAGQLFGDLSRLPALDLHLFAWASECNEFVFTSPTAKLPRQMNLYRCGEALDESRFFAYTDSINRTLSVEKSEREPMYTNNHLLRQRIALFRRILPPVLALMVVLYQFGLARWVYNSFGYSFYFGLEILFYALVGPLFIYWTLKLIDRWLDEEEQTVRWANASEHCLASITSVSVDAILSVDANGLIETWNRGAELLFDYPAIEIHNQPFSVLMGGGAAAGVEIRWLKEMVQQEGFVRGHETICRDANGRTIDVELTATLLTDDNDKPPGMSIILRDITNRKRHEEEIRQLNVKLKEQVAVRTHELTTKVEELGQANAVLQKLDQARSEFVSLLSHQIRAPLTNMAGALQRMQVDCAAINPTCRRMFAISNQQIARLDRLVQDVLNASRLENGEMTLQSEPISVLPVVQQVVEQLRARITDRPVRFPAKPGLPLVYADRDLVAEVLVNLLDNADKYSPPGVELALEMRADQTEVTISVTDSGPGLPPEDLELVFDRYYRTDSSDAQLAYGYGLGLYVCHRLVKAQGGRIWAENHPNGGAVFSFTLPVWQG